MTSSTGTVVFNDAKLQAVDVVATERLGVGTLDPTSNLHVVGNVHVTGNVNKLNFTDGYTIKRGANVTVFGTTDVIQEITGPHARASPPLRKYPEIAFTEGLFGGNDSTNTYTQAGYTVSASSTSNSVYPVWNVHSGIKGGGDFYSSTGGFIGASNTYVGNSSLGGISGEWVKTKFPVPIKMTHVDVTVRDSSYAAFDWQSPSTFYIIGSNDDTTWSSALGTVVDRQYTASDLTERVILSNTNYYKYYAIVVTKVSGNRSVTSIDEIEYYGYEEDPPAGDTSVDTTITSQFNLPDTTGVKLYIDGDKGSTPTDYSGEGHTLTDNSESFSGNAWSFSSLSTSNVTMSTGDLAMEGTHPHSVSLWFNCANVTSNATLFHVGTEAGEGDAKTAISLTETGHLGWIDGGDNQFLSSNTWHHLVYATQGGGGLRTCYLDGRKLGDVSDQDTFGEYPTFAMTGYSQGGYLVSSNYETSTEERKSYNAFNSKGASYRWQVSSGYSTTGDYLAVALNGVLPSITDTNGTTHLGHWLKLELPHRLRLNGFKTTNSTGASYYMKSYVILGSNDDVNWTLLHSEADANLAAGSGTHETGIHGITESFKYLKLLVKSLASSNSTLIVTEVFFYGHKENDTTRFPVSSTVLKYPHIAMTGQAGTASGVSDLYHAQRGYEVTASSMYTANASNPYQPWRVFDETESSVWFSRGLTNLYGGTDNAYGSVATANLGTDSGGSATHGGEWLKLELPRKIVLNSIVMNSSGSEAPEDFTLYGSNNGSSWTEILSETGLAATTSGATYTPSSTPSAYKYFGVVITKTVSRNNYTGIRELKLYGTEEDLDIVARVGEGLDGKVANFRVYDKYLREEQALELWDAQKDQFGRATSSVSVYKGHVGIGTTTPEAALTVMDEAEEMEEFPPRALSDSLVTYIEGHGIFKVDASKIVTGTNATINVFDKKYLDAGASFWIAGTSSSDGAGYNTSNGYYEGENGVIYRLAPETSAGQYVTLEMPYRVKLEKYLFMPRYDAEYQTPKDFELWGSNDGHSWTKLHSVIGNTEYLTSVTYDAPQTNYYRYFGFIVTRTIMTGAPSGYDYMSFAELKFFGTRERGQSTLHDGELKLTKNLTVPRIGPALNGGWASQTPRRDHLVVEYDTSTYLHNNKAMDSSGNEIHGTFNGATYSPGEGAFTFDGTDDIRSTVSTFSGDQPHTMSTWVYISSALTTTDAYICVLAPSTGENIDQVSTIRFQNDGFNMQSWGNDIQMYNLGIQKDRWYHLTAVYDGGGVTTSSKRLYINGVQNLSISTDGTSGNVINFTNTTLSLGSRVDGTGSHLKGSISNFKIYDVALGPGEVRKLYEMGRNGPGNYMNIVDTAVAIGRHAPQAQLDVSGKIRANGANTNFTGQHRCSSAQGPLEKGLVVSASKNTYRNITGGLSAGPKAITIDESLPVVSLSNVAQDKACFGVVSRMEEANTLTRSETVGGLISEDSKVLGDNRVIVNSVGEGAIWVCDVNGPLESGDYITTSNVAGYGQKQDGEFLANYTVAKITMDCDFTASNVAVQAIKKVETLKTVTEDVWEGLRDYDRSSNTETQYINESNVVLSVEEYESLAPEEQNTYSETTIQTYYQIQRGENILDEHGMLQWEDTGATEPGYELRYLDASGQQTDEANCVHRAAFVGCTYHCG